MTQTIPTFAQSLDLHSKSLIKGTTIKDIQDSKTFDECYILLHSFVYYTDDVTDPDNRKFLMSYENMLRFIKLINKPNTLLKDKETVEDKHREAYQLAYDNFIKNKK